jgi:hypothetical protein
MSSSGTSFQYFEYGNFVFQDAFPSMAARKVGRKGKKSRTEKRERIKIQSN